MKRKIIIEIISSLLILLFLYASVSKWLAFKTFIGDMNNQPFPNWMTPYLVYSIPVIEVLIAVGLIFEKTRVPALYASFVLMMAFTIYTVAVLSHAFRYVPCSCGGVIKKLTWPQHLFFNLFFVGISLLGIWLKKRDSLHEVRAVSA
ncbi:MAG: MauE/DoxX family redox-associated membrane protein [Niastella sp.]|jgi:putative oxidoreductase|uniref:MauE/DoxX family redox-associated membrane protein n=1 Tax=Niastella sp. TaxID=1869183 RepID=UPI00389AAD3B